MLRVDIPGDLALTGTLRASINLGNPVLAQGTPAAPRGVTVEIANELGARLHVPVQLLCFDERQRSCPIRQGATITGSDWPPRGLAGPGRNRSGRPGVR
jgi:hypothetical protein